MADTGSGKKILIIIVIIAILLALVLFGGKGGAQPAPAAKSGGDYIGPLLILIVLGCIGAKVAKDKEKEKKQAQPVPTAQPTAQPPIPQKQPKAQPKLRVLVLAPWNRSIDFVTREVYPKGSWKDLEHYYYKKYRDAGDPTKRACTSDRTNLKTWLAEDLKGLGIEVIDSAEELGKRHNIEKTFQGKSGYDIILIPSLDATRSKARVDLPQTLMARWDPRGGAGYCATIFTAPSFRNASTLWGQKKIITPSGPKLGRVAKTPIIFKLKAPLLNATYANGSPLEADFTDSIIYSIKPREACTTTNNIKGDAALVAGTKWPIPTQPRDAYLIYQVNVERYKTRGPAQFPLITYLNFDLWSLKGKGDKRYEILLDTIKSAIDAMQKQLADYNAQQAKRPPRAKVAGAAPGAGQSSQQSAGGP